MDETTLASLRAALQASPDNAELLGVVLSALLDRGEAAEAVAVLGERTPDALPTEAQRRLAARALLAKGHAARAEAFAQGDEPPTQLLRARILLALDRQAEAREAYQAAVAGNPTLEDTDLAAALAAKVRAIAPQEGRPRLRVISNDDTDDTEVTRLLAPSEDKVTFADVGGLDEIKRQIHKRIILPFKKPSLFQRFKKRVGGGILMYGPPGCGKTLLARATAGECDAAFFNVAISDILDMYIGESERKLHAIFDKARQSTPAILFFDELEALAGKRQFTREGTSSKLVSQFLNEMDGFSQENRGVLILGATNVPWAIDPAFRRPGRFDRVLFVPPPDRPARERILELMLRERPVEAGVDPARYAQKTSGLSGADLSHLVEAATDEAIEESLEREEEISLGARHLDRALTQVKPTSLEWLTTARNYARYANEAGQYDDVLAFLDRHGKR